MGRGVLPDVAKTIAKDIDGVEKKREPSISVSDDCVVIRYTRYGKSVFMLTKILAITRLN